MKIVILDGYTLNPGDISWQGIEALGELTVYDRTAPDLVAKRIGNAEIVLTNKTVLTRDVIASCKNLKFIGVLATGYNVVDVATAKECGIVVSNIPTYGTMAVAQFAAALLLEMCHHVGSHSDDARAGNWVGREDFCYWNHPLIELSGKNLGLIGFGRIGQTFGRVAQALGMTILAFDDYQDKSLESNTLRYVGLDELFAQSDVISLHCPFFDSTKGIINAVNIEKMKPGVMLINTSRGPLIVDQDLADALNSGRVAAAAVDVLSEEPPAANNPLLSAKNCIVTPHIAWAPKEARTRLMGIATDNLAKFLTGTPQNVVNG